MADPSAGTYRLTYAFDAGFLSGAPPSDSPRSTDSHDRESQSKTIPHSESSEESNRLADLSASLRVFSESFLRMESADMEMAKAREASRIEAETRRAETEAEMVQMLATTQLQIASFLSRKSLKRKRKRVAEEDSSIAERQGLLLLWLLQCNLGF